MPLSLEFKGDMLKNVNDIVRKIDEIGGCPVLMLASLDNKLIESPIIYLTEDRLHSDLVTLLYNLGIKRSSPLFTIRFVAAQIAPLETG